MCIREFDNEAFDSSFDEGGQNIADEIDKEILKDVYKASAAGRTYEPLSRKWVDDSDLDHLLYRVDQTSRLTPKFYRSCGEQNCPEVFGKYAWERIGFIQWVLCRDKHITKMEWLNYSEIFVGGKNV